MNQGVLPPRSPYEAIARAVAITCHEEVMFSGPGRTIGPLYVCVCVCGRLLLNYMTKD